MKIYCVAVVAIATALSLAGCASTTSVTPSNTTTPSATAQPTTPPPSAVPSSAPPIVLPTTIVPAAPTTDDNYVPPAAPTQAPDQGGGGNPGASCSITTDAGNCYSAGEYCRESDLGQTTTDADGRSITCVMESGKPHWHH